MAFDMISGLRQDAFEHSEEVIFHMALNDKRRFSNLLYIWDLYYDDPWLSATQAKNIASELSDLLTFDEVKSNTRLFASISRLVRFFTEAHLANTSIKCQSD